MTRHRHRLHGRRVLGRQRLTALILVATGILQASVWGLMLLLGLLGVPFASRLLASVRFISEISLWALVLACWAQVAASLAQLTAGDAHQDAEAARVEFGVDAARIEEDVARLAELQPSPEAYRLRDEIRRRLREGSA